MLNVTQLPFAVQDLGALNETTPRLGYTIPACSSSPSNFFEYKLFARNDTRQKYQSYGFSLVELSIVIIIIGLLVAGVTAGLNLINKAEQDSIITDLKNYYIAYGNFNSRYNAVPGDFNAAETVWPNCTTTPGSCIGNGNGIIDQPTEIIAAWRHLSLAGMISASIADPGTRLTGQPSPLYTNPQLGTTTPESKIVGVGYTMALGNESIIGYFGLGLWNDQETNAVFVGGFFNGSVPASLNDIPVGYGITGLRAFNIDKKIDDGAFDGTNYTGVTTGSVRTFNAIYINPADNFTCVNASSYIVTGDKATCTLALALN